MGILLFAPEALAQSKKRATSGKNKLTINDTSAVLPALGRQLSDSIPSLGALLVWQKDKLIYEGYFHGASGSTSFNVKSVTKSILSAIAGVAHDKGELTQLNAPVLSVLPEYAKPLYASGTVWYAEDKKWNDSLRATLTLKHLLTMQTGLQWSDFGSLVGAFVASSDPVRFMLDIPYETTPGTKFNYCSGAASVFAAALAKKLNTDLRSFAEMHLFNPAGIKLDRWDTDPLGRYVGSAEMYLTPVSMLNFGLLYLQQGRVKGKQILSQNWIRESTAKQADVEDWDVMPGANGYGYYWWRRKINGHQAYVASGYGGQLICVVPDQNMVIVTTCFLNKANRGRSEIKRIHLFIDQIVSAADN